MRQVIIRIVRSAIQILTLGIVQTLIGVFDFLDRIGVAVDQAEVVIAIETVLFALWMWALTWAEGRWPVVSRILSLNLAENSGIDGYQPTPSQP